jgi:hypothetical protein
VITIVNRSHTDLGVYVGRPSIFGNPFEIGKDGTRSEVIEKFEVYFVERLEKDPLFKKEFDKLVEMARNGDLMLACWCVPNNRCHGEVIQKYIERELNNQKFRSVFKIGKLDFF